MSFLLACPNCGPRDVHEFHCQGEVTVRLSKGGRVVNGVGADTDIVVASAKAYISALNKLASKIERVNPQHQH